MFQILPDLVVKIEPLILWKLLDITSNDKAGPKGR